MYKPTLVDPQVQQRAVNLIRPLIPPDAEDRVKGAVKRSNPAIRQIIRDETGLRLGDGSDRQSVQVKIVNGFTGRMARLISHYDDPVLWRLIMAQPRLGGVIDGLAFLLEDWESFEHWDQLPPVAKGGEDALRRAIDIALALQQTSITKRVQGHIREIDEDILGMYFYPGGRTPWIELYWMPIAMFAAMLNVRPDDLALVVLAHELAHAYTHVGRDIDGVQWNTSDFGRTDTYVKEGLAQFYTEVVADRMASRMPQMRTAYDGLLGVQSGPYLAHQRWLPSRLNRRGEIVRFTTLSGRSKGAVSHEQWCDMLNETEQALKGNGKTGLTLD